MDVKQRDPAFVVEEDIYDLLKKITKCKDFSSKYRDRAQETLDSILNFDSYIISDNNRFARTAKKETDYSEKKEKKRATGKKGDTAVEDEITKEEVDSDAYGDENENEDGEDVEEDLKPKISELVIPTSISEIAQKNTKAPKSSTKITIKTSVKINKRPRLT